MADLEHALYKAGPPERHMAPLQRGEPHGIPPKHPLVAFPIKSHAVKPFPLCFYLFLLKQGIRTGRPL